MSQLSPNLPGVPGRPLARTVVAVKLGAERVNAVDSGNDPAGVELPNGVKFEKKLILLACAGFAAVTIPIAKAKAVNDHFLSIFPPEVS